MFQNDVNDYIEHFDSYLDDGKTIASFNIQVDSGLMLESSSNTDDDVLYRIKAISSQNNNGSYISQVTIIVTTSSSRVETRRIFFSVERASANG